MKLDVHTSSSKRANLARDWYDIALVAGSWDSRSLVFADSSLAVGLTIVLTLSPDLYSEHAQENQLKTLRHAADVSSKVVQLEADRKSPMATLRAVVHNIREKSAELRRPVRLLVDLSAVSRFVSLGVMASTFRDSSVVEIDFLYATATEYGRPLSDMRDGYIFRSGDWLPTAIPGLGSTGSLGKKQHLLVSAGFEGRRTRRLMDLLEPDYVTLFASTSEIQINNDILDSQLSLLRNAVPPNRFDEYQVPIASVEEMLTQSAQTIQPSKPGDREKSHSILLAGPKTASLGLAILALRGGVTNVFYVQSERHEEVDVVSVDQYLRYTVGPPWGSTLLQSLNGTPQ